MLRRYGTSEHFKAYTVNPVVYYYHISLHIQSSENFLNNRIRAIFTLCTFGASGLGHDEPVPVAALLVVVAHAQVVPNLVGHHVDRREARRRVGFTLKQPVVNCNTRCYVI